MNGQIPLLCGVVLFCALAILAKDLIKAAISLAVASVLLGILFFTMNAPYAGVFEISVVAGLITVLFMLTIALTKAEDEVRERRWVKIVAAGAESGSFGDVLWKQRTFDLIGQLAVILAGVFAVLALFRKKDKHD